MQYRRANTAGGTYFFTVNLAERKRTLLTDHIDMLRSAIRYVKRRHPFNIDAVVVLPDHLHTIWTLPENDANFAMRWSLIKAGFSRALPKTERINNSRRKKRERGIWQRRYWEHQIRDDIDFHRHVDYVHNNPVKHGYVRNPADWLYSSIHVYIRTGKIPASWSVGLDEDDGFGE